MKPLVKHTPGPWRVESVKGWRNDLCIMAGGPKPIFKAVKPDAYYTDYAPGSTPGSVILSDEIAAKQGRYVATKEIRAELDAVEAANAHLVAAAPELFSALEDMVRWHGKRDIATDELLPPEQQDNEVANAMRALAKAEGRSDA